MPKKSVNSGSKVMDVSKPGKGKISTNSRSVATNKVEVKDTTVKPEEPTAEAADESQSISAPSATRKVIQPISADLKTEEPSTTEIKVISDNPETDEPKEEDKPAESSDDTPAGNSGTTNIAVKIDSDSGESSDELNKSEPQDTATEESPEVDKAEVSSAPDSEPDTEAETDVETSTEPKDETKPEPQPEAENPDSPGDADAAGVDELAKTAEAKRTANKKAEEEKLRFAELEDVAASKKYFVKTSNSHHTASGSSKKIVFLIVGLIAILVGAYLVVDSRLIDNSIKLPYEFFIEEKIETEPLVAEPDEAKTDEQAAEAKLLQMRDDERVSEVNDLQEQLEAYFVENDQYPVDLTVIEPELNVGQLQGPNEDAYIYTAGPADCDNTEVVCDSYTLTAQLENEKNENADENSQYVVKSVNQ